MSASNLLVRILLCIGALLVFTETQVLAHRVLDHDFGDVTLEASGGSSEADFVDDQWKADPQQWANLLSSVMKERYRFSFGMLWTGDSHIGSTHFHQLVNASSYNVLVLAAGDGVVSSALLKNAGGTGLKVVTTDFRYLEGGVPELLNSKANTSVVEQHSWICGADNTKLLSNQCIQNFIRTNGEFDLILMKDGMCSHGDEHKICAGCAAGDLPGFFDALTTMTKNGGTWMFANLNSLTLNEEGTYEPPKFFQQSLRDRGYAEPFQYEEFKEDMVKAGMPWMWVQTVSK